MKKILILGGGIYQAPLIKKAYEMGLYTIVVSVKGNYPGFELANKIYYVDTTDIQKVIDIAKTERIDAICTTGTDVALESLGAVCDALNLIGITKRAGMLATNKREMKNAFMSADVTTAQYREVKNLQNAIAAFNSLNKPVIFKAVDSSGSRGVIRVDSHEQVERSYTKVMKATRKEYIIIEEFIVGVEFGAQACVNNGDITFFMPHGDVLFTADAGVPIGHFVPYELTGELYETAYLELKKCISALELNNCAINVDFIQKGNEVYILEVGARAGATCLPEVVSIHYGIDFYKYLIELSLGLNPNFNSANILIPCSAMLLKSDHDGKIACFNKVPISGKIVDVSLDYSIGEAVRKFRVGPDRIGQIIVKGESFDSMMNEINEITKLINVQVEE